MNFSEHLADIRKTHHFTQKQVAKGIGVPLSTYQRYEYGEREPAFSKLIALADFFGVSLDYLVGRDFTPPSAPPASR